MDSLISCHSLVGLGVGQGLNPKWGISNKMEYKKYFFGDYLSADLCQ